MKKIIAWLEENGIEYKLCQYGNPYYFNDGFSVKGIQVSFYFDGIGNELKKERLLLDYMKRKKSYVCQRTWFGAGYTYRILATLDALRLKQHEKAVTEAVEKFWQEEHERRMMTEKMA